MKEPTYRMNPVREGNQFYYPICLFEKHPGPIKQNSYRACERKKCRYFFKAYVPGIEKKVEYDKLGWIKR